MARPTSPTTQKPLTKSQELLTVHPFKPFNGETSKEYAERVTKHLLESERHKAHEEDRGWSEDPAEQWVSEDTAVSAFRTWGSDPLGLVRPNIYKELFDKLWQDLSPSPLQREKDARSRALRSADLGHGKMSREAVLEHFPAKGSDQAQSAELVWQKWQDDEPLYSPHNIYRMFDTTLGYNQWKKNHNLPDLLTYRQTLWLLKTASTSPRFKFKIGKRAIAKNLCREECYGHLFEIGAKYSAVKTKVGRKYGSIKLLECLSEDETTTNNANVYYKAVCEECGFEFPRFNYRHISRPCPECTRASKAASIGKKQIKFRNPITVYMVENGSILMSHTKPEDAVAYAVVTQYNQLTAWVYFGGRKASQQVESERHAPQDFTLDPDKLLKKEDLYGFD